MKRHRMQELEHAGSEVQFAGCGECGKATPRLLCIILLLSRQTAITEQRLCSCHRPGICLHAAAAVYGRIVSVSEVCDRHWGHHRLTGQLSVLLTHQLQLKCLTSRKKNEYRCNNKRTWYAQFIQMFNSFGI